MGLGAGWGIFFYKGAEKIKRQKGGKRLFTSKIRENLESGLVLICKIGQIGQVASAQALGPGGLATCRDGVTVCPITSPEARLFGQGWLDQENWGTPNARPITSQES